MDKHQGGYPHGHSGQRPAVYRWTSGIPLVFTCGLHDAMYRTEVPGHATAGGLPRRVSVHLAVRATVDLPSQGRVFCPGLCALEGAIDVEVEEIVPAEVVSRHVTK